MPLPSLSKLFGGSPGPQPRRSESGCSLYCIGTAKSGTQSIGAMFDSSVNAAHEPDYKELTQIIMDRHAGRIDRAVLHARLLERDRRLALDVDSAFMNFYILDPLMELFPKAKFVLTIRDCYSWLNSITNHSYKFPNVSTEWIQCRDFRFKRDEFTHGPGEQAFKEKGLYTLDAYFSHWEMQNREVIAKVPRERLLVVRTDRISARAAEIAHFAGLPAAAIRGKKTHSHENKTKVDMLKDLDRDYLEQKVDKYCRPLMREFFPDIPSLDAAKI